MVLTGNGKIGINIADNTTADLQVRTGTNGAGVFRLGGSNGNGVGMDATYSNSGATSTIFKQNYRSTHASALMEFDSGYFVFKTGTAGDETVRIQSGNVGIGSATPTQKLDVDGIIAASQGLRVPNGSATTNYISVGNNLSLIHI